MGISICNAERSPRLADIVTACEGLEDDEYDGQDYLNDACDLTSTSGYDNDGSTGPELVDNGIGLGIAATKHGEGTKIFYANGENTCYFAYGWSEDEMVERVRAGLGPVWDLIT